MDDFSYAAPATLQGMLQRGRGLGAHRALTRPGAADLVYECVIHDSRWDRLVEERDSYLARLILRLELPLAPVEQHLFGYDGDDADAIEPLLQVLALLPLAGRTDAVAVLRRYAAEGRHWATALEAIDSAGSGTIPEIWAGLDEAVVAHNDDTELADRIMGVWEPWPTLARSQPRIRRILDELGARRDARPQATGLPRRPAPEDALTQLATRRGVTLLDLAEDPGLRNSAGWTPGMPQALRRLGTAAVPRARTWLAGDDGTLQELALRILSDHGDRDDGPCLLDALTTATAESSWCAAETPARGLGRLRFGPAADALVHSWEATVHSPAREAFFDGLRGCAPATAAALAVEGLDDCEPLVQRAACAAVPDTPSVRARLVELSDDPLAPEVHDAARQRLA